MRAALNYLIVALARTDTLKQGVPSRLQFPIESSQDNFRKNRPNYLHGLTSEHVTMIERVQPYTGCYWTKFIQRLSNKGKHIELVRLVHTTAALTEHETDAWIDTIINSILDDREAIEECRCPNSVTVDIDASTCIAFADGHPVIETLYELQTQVTNFIEEFKL